MLKLSGKAVSSEAEMGFFDHLDALRWHLIRSAVVVCVMAVVVFVYNDVVFGQIIFGPKHPDFWTYQALCKFSHWMGAGESLCIGQIPFDLINTELSGQFTMHMWVAFVGGLIVSFPYVLWELWRFIKPGLHHAEVNATQGFVFWASILFIIGVLFSYFMIVPLTINFLGSYKVSNDVANMVSMDSYISTVVTLTLACGLVFELPIVIYFLTGFGIVTPQFMRKYRKHAVLIILVVSGIITPSPDITSQMLVAVPLYILYEVSIFVSAYVIAKQKRSV